MSACRSIAAEAEFPRNSFTPRHPESREFTELGNRVYLPITQ
jgi:hypothetical protein